MLLPNEAWEELRKHTTRYYRKNLAMYSGLQRELAATATRDTFWRSDYKNKIHMPLAADIASTSADLLFAELPEVKVQHEGSNEQETPQQDRLNAILDANSIGNMLSEAAETASASGDVYLKVVWNKSEYQEPKIKCVPATAAWPEYVLGMLVCIHFFTFLRQTDSAVWRVYERYERDKIVTTVFKGSKTELGGEDGAAFTALRVAPVATTGGRMLAAHIPNMRPIRFLPESPMGRSDLEGLRDMHDALDQAYSSWMRDLRVGAARVIVPADYLKRKVDFSTMGEGVFTWEFGDGEAYTALDIDPEHAGAQAITPVEFKIRSDEHLKACTNFVSSIVTTAGYSPQTFGIDIEGNAQSGTALRVREKKSFTRQGKKQNYWKGPLEQLLTDVVHLDAELYPASGSHAEDIVKVAFADGVADDMTTISTCVELLKRAQAASTQTLVQMVHPDWNEKQIGDEVEEIKKENQIDLQPPMNAPPDPGMGDLEDGEGEQA